LDGTPLNRRVRAPLDDVFLALTGRSLRETTAKHTTDHFRKGRSMSSTLTSPSTQVETSRPPRRGILRDTGIVMVRELRPVLHDPFSVVFGIVQPLIFLALFGPLLIGSLGGPTVLGDNVWQWFVPSILVMTTLFGTASAGSNLLFEFPTGAHERMLVTPLSWPSLLIGRSLKEIA
jgi:ABC-2 type transport system permease protein